jgi:hypothetical protein
MTVEASKDIDHALSPSPIHRFRRRGMKILSGDGYQLGKSHSIAPYPVNSPLALSLLGDGAQHSSSITQLGAIEGVE